MESKTALKHAVIFRDDTKWLMSSCDSVNMLLVLPLPSPFLLIWIILIGITSIKLLPVQHVSRRQIIIECQLDWKCLMQWRSDAVAISQFPRRLINLNEDHLIFELLEMATAADLEWLWLLEKSADERVFWRGWNPEGRSQDPPGYWLISKPSR